MDKKNIVMFGASKMGEAAYILLKDRYNITYFSDNDKNKWGKSFCNLKIISPEELKRKELRDAKIIITSMYYKAITQQLKDMKLEDIEIFNFESNSIKQIEKDKEDLNYIKSYIDKIKLDNNKKYNLHIMIDNFYCKRFIEFINKNYDQKEHKFVVLTNGGIKYVDNIEEYENVESLYNSKYTDLRLYSYIKESKKTFIHYLTDNMCKFICDYNIDKYTEVNWILWGGDLYEYTDIELYDEKTKKLISGKHNYILDLESYKATEDYNYRKEAIKKMKFILPDGIWNDYDIVKKFFDTDAAMKKFLYPNPVNFESIEADINNGYGKIIQEDNIKEKYKYIIQVGNSGDPTNNHLDILEKLKNMKNKDFAILCPLSYGNIEYINELISIGKNMFGDRFIPLTKFMDKEQYYQILNQVDVAIMNHNRQQALGNIFLLLYLKKKVFIRKETTVYKSFIDYGIKVYDIDLLNNDFSEVLYMEDDLKDKNKEIINKLYSSEMLISWMNNIFY